MRAGDVADVQARPGLPGQRAVAGHDRLLGGGGPAREPQPRRRPPPSCACAPPVSRWSSACWAITTSSAVAYSSALRMISGSCTQRPSSENIRTCAGERAIVPSSAIRSPRRPDGDGADRMHVDEPDLGAAAAHVQRDDVGVDDRSGVGHREHGGEPAERRRGRARRDRLGLLAARLAQVGVQVDEPRQQRRARRRRASRRRRARTRSPPPRRRAPGRRPDRPRRTAGHR